MAAKTTSNRCKHPSTLADLLASFRDQDGRSDGKGFEHLGIWFLLNDPAYPQIKKVCLWDDWSGRWGPDCGIDLVAETEDGNLWAIQCKDYSEDNSVTKSHLDSFLSESGTGEFSYRLLIMTTNRLADNADRLIKRYAKSSAVKVGVLYLSDLQEADIDWAAYQKKTSGKRKPQTMRPHQIKAFQDITVGPKGLGFYDRCQAILACGTGKTLLGLRVAEWVGGNTLVLFPSLSLLKQNRAAWLRNRLEDFHVLEVCSDPTVTKGTDAEDIIACGSLGFPVTTDPQVIRKFMRSPGRKVIFSTYDSSPMLKGLKFDLVICDEAHHCTGKTTSPFTYVLDNRNIKAARRLFMTATPRIFRNGGEEVISMDDEARFGPVAHRLSFRDAITLKLLCDYTIVVSVVTNEVYRNWIQVGLSVDANGHETDARTLAGQIGVALAMRKFDLSKVLTFSNTIKAAAKFAGSFHHIIGMIPKRKRLTKPLWAAHISGKMSAGTRGDLLKAFANWEGHAVFSNSKCLGEGIDVKAIDAIVFNDPKSSVVDIAQALGRAIRLSPETGKTCGYIIIPVILDEDQTIDEAMEDSSWTPVWNVLRAMKAHDDALQQFLLYRQQGERSPNTPEDIEGPLQIISPTRLTADFVKAFRTKAYEQVEGRLTWEEQLYRWASYAA